MIIICIFHIKIDNFSSTRKRPRTWIFFAIDITMIKKMDRECFLRVTKKGLCE